jgi:ABC-type uncharacterized transport system permease subunit
MSDEQAGPGGGRGPLGALAVLALPFVLLVLAWTFREPPGERAPCGVAANHDAWIAGLAPASFAAAVYCAAFLFWLSGRTRGGDPSPTTVIAVVAGLAVAGLWWAGGDTVGWFLVWPVLAMILLLPSAILVPGLIIAMVRSPEPRAWRLLQALAWWSALVLLPGFVAFVDSWGVDFYC